MLRAKHKIQGLRLDSASYPSQQGYFFLILKVVKTAHYETCYVTLFSTVVETCGPVVVQFLIQDACALVKFVAKTVLIFAP